LIRGAILAYIGPGAGFAVGGSLLALLLAVAGAVVSILLWPFRACWGYLRSRRALRRAHVRKLIFIGFDGLDPRLTERLMAEGKLPHLARLRESGGYRRLRTTFPVLSPVAWSTFATGVNPARHNIFDFLNRSVKSYVPELSSAKVASGGQRKFGPFRFLRPPSVEGKRRSESFWAILGRHRIRSIILRVPVTFPPEKFNGLQLSAMGTPDLKGTQGSFSVFSVDPPAGDVEGGSHYPLKIETHGYSGFLEGPRDASRVPGRTLRIPFRVEESGDSRPLVLRIQGESYELRPHEYTPWIRVKFRFSPFRSVFGIVRFLVTSTGKGFSLYVSPVEIDPENPGLPISHPGAYAGYLAKLIGVFATLGMAEDTWALNERVLSERDFLSQAYSIFDERLRMFTDALEKTRKGVAGCVFDTSDRIQHLFFRQMHDPSASGEFGGVIEEMYRRMDDVVGLAMRHVDSATALVVLSDHGFCAFDRGVNLNAWLRENGYLSVVSDDGGKYFAGVNWKTTRAYALGLGGLYLNLKGREPEGTVAPGEEARALKRELIEKLTGLRDEAAGRAAIRNVYDADVIYSGPYMDRAPDLIIGYHEGYRTGWGAAVGKTGGPVFEENDRPWSGDHCVDPPLVPGILFANRPIDSADPGIEDMAPSFLRLFGVDPPNWMEGKAVLEWR
jgi:predicted AlkP superfamily phosphohydrolase/phosphomutase